MKIKNLKTSTTVYLSPMNWEGYENFNNCLTQSDELGKGIPYWLLPIFVQACPHAYM